MQYRPLGRSGLTVSAISLGTMTWGEQNTEAEAHAQMDAARDRGVTFFDTAELYPVPPRAETQGRTESYIGSWFHSRGTRDKIILATKVVGPSTQPQFRNGAARLDRANILEALEGSLRRLQTDYIDVYYLHWPERRANFFGRLGYEPDPEGDAQAIALEDTLAVLDEQVRAGTIRHVAVSNETAWGVMRYAHLAETRGLPRPACIQNPYNLLNRSFEVGLAEAAQREAIPLCAYSPLAMGVLSGKYLEGGRPAGARLTLFPDSYPRYQKPRGVEATARYVALARAHGLDPAQMALAYVNSRPFVASTIIGATTVDQLARDIDSIDLALSSEVLAGIEAIHAEYTYPCP
ncbi:NADP(H)-dependent aldo-keto reductase [Roseospira marina]|uniref:Protein tas n=1 Tax=Roseospira marina TaxID=140057 RepID=A0A5M6I6E2_9PROT|nr:NADP(H)-dependent aldo-keto reductase [Roseospira marina]KAA5603742.1 NADP(H)-dependent aldo-keto reductase [Roseospira marina]MBB4316070.1 aryl-alcohol dehydrogenase-like predicted oxidoreductase [Roseospira marina]MBB5089212.1 aryl-alcohol dehydrogenase-like predicted oxidoreductase [Roseospira marina]